MTEFVFAHPSPYDVSITLAIFDNWEQATRRMFPLRNLTGQSADEQVDEATALMAEVAAELHHITGYGIDKGTVKLNGKKAHDVIYGDYMPAAGARYFRYGVKIGFNSTCSYQWVNGRQHSWRIYEKRFSEAWQQQIWQEHKAATFRIPCMVGSNPQQRNEHFFYYLGNKKQGRKVTGWHCYFDRQDVIFNRFINRFYDEGNLALGQERYWGQLGCYVSVDGVDWALPKLNTSKAPRKSKLASQPRDDTDYVYLIRMGRTKFYKIGKSNDPQGRLASMQTASPYKLKMVHVFKADNAAAAEEALHHRLHGARKKGEWFKLTDEQQSVILSVTAYEDGQFIVQGIKRKIEGLFLE